MFYFIKNNKSNSGILSLLLFYNFLQTMSILYANSYKFKNNFICRIKNSTENTNAVCASIFSTTQLISTIYIAKT